MRRLRQTLRNHDRPKHPIFIHVEPLEPRFVLSSTPIQLFEFDQNGMATLTDAIDSDGEAAVYRFQVSQTGILTIQQDSLDVTAALVRLLDSDGNEIAGQQNLQEALFRVEIPANQMLSIEVLSANPNGGLYSLNLEFVADDIGSDGTILILDENGAAQFNGAIDFSGDADDFRLLSDVARRLTITVDAQDFSLDPQLRVFNETTGMLLGFDDDGGSELNSRLTVDIPSGQVIRITASAFSTTAGSYLLNVESTDLPQDDIGPDGTILALDEAGTAQFTGVIDFSGDHDDFLLTSDSDRILTINLTSPDYSLYYSQLQIVDEATGESLKFSDNGRVSVNVDTGQTIRITVSSYYSTTGAYLLDIRTAIDDIGPTGTSLTLDESGTAQFTGAIDFDEDTDVFVLTADSDRNLVISITPLDYSAPRVQVLDDVTGESLASADYGNVSVSVTAGQAIRIIASAYYRNLFGAYILNVATDIGNTSDSAGFLPLIDGVGTVDSSLDSNSDGTQDRDFFRITIPDDGLMRVSIDPRGRLDPMVVVRNGVGEIVALNDDRIPLQPHLGSQVEFNARRGEIYTIEVRPFDVASSAAGTDSLLSQGAYTLRVERSGDITPDDVGNTFSTASFISFEEGFTLQQVSIDYDADQDVFRFVAQRDGTILLSSQSVNHPMDAYLTVFDGSSSHRILASSPVPATPHSASYLEFLVQQGATYFIRASVFSSQQSDAYGASLGSYGLGLAFSTRPLQDNTFDLIPDSPLNLEGRIDTPGDIDQFLIHTYSPGNVSVAAQTQDSSLQSRTFSAYLVGDNFEYAGHRVISISSGSLELSNVQADQTYLILIQGNDQSTGAYTLTINQTGADDFPDFIQDSSQILTPGTAITASLGQYDTDVFRLSVPMGTTAEFLLEPITATVAPALYMNGMVDPLINTFRFGVDAFRPVRIDGSDNPVDVFIYGFDTAGRYRLQLTSAVSDEFADDFDSAAIITGEGDQLSPVTGRFESGIDRDFYRFTALFTGQLQIHATDSSTSGLPLFNQLVVYSQDQYPLAYGGDFYGDADADATVSVEVAQGFEYYIELNNQDRQTGNYRINFARVTAVDDVGPDGLDLAFNTQGTAAFTGAVEVLADTDVFRAQSAFDTTLQISLEAADASRLDSVLTVFDDDTGAQLAFNDDTAGLGLNSRVAVHVQSGQRLRIVAAGYGSSTGTYTLNIIPLIDDVPGDGVDLLLNGQGAAEFNGAIETTGDADDFRIQPTVSGTYEITLDSVGERTLSPSLSVADGNGQTLANSVGSGFNSSSQITVDLIAGEAIDIQVSGVNSSSGAYRLSMVLVTDDIGDQPFLLTLDNNGQARFMGAIDFVGDSDQFQFSSIAGQTVSISMDAMDISPFDTYLTIQDSSGTTLAFDDDSGPGLNSLLSVTVPADGILQIVASSFGSSTGSYQLAVRTVDNQEADETDQIIVLTVGARQEISGSLNLPFDTDIFTFTATYDGIVTVEENAAGSLRLDPLLRIQQLSGAGSLEIASDDDGGPGLNSLVSFNVHSGVTYQIIAGGFGSSFGDYQLNVQLSGGQDDFGDSFSAASPLALRDGTIFFRGGTISSLADRADVDVFAFNSGSYSGTVNFRVRAFSPGFQPGIAVFTGDSHSGQIDNLILLDVSNRELSRADQASVFVGIEASRDYYVRVFGLNGSTGTYFLGGSATLDDIPSSQAGAVTLTISESIPAIRQDSIIDYISDSDLFRIVAPKAGRFHVGMTDGPDSTLDPVVTVYNSQNVPIGRNDDRLTGGTDSELTFNAVATGDVFFINAAGFQSSTGRYELQIEFEPSDSANAQEPGDVPFDARLLTVSSDQPTVRFSERFEVPGDLDYFTFLAAEDGVVSAGIEMSGSEAGGSRIRVLQSDDDSLRQRGLDSLTQIDSGSAEVQFEVIAGQRYFLELHGKSDSQMASLNYSLAVHFASGTAETSGGKDQRSNEATNQQFQITLADQSFDDSVQAALNELRATEGVGTDRHLDRVYFILLVDPVDFLLTDPSGRTVGYTADAGTVREASNAYFSGNGFGELVIIPNADAGTYQLTLSGVGGTTLAHSYRVVAVGPEGIMSVNSTVTDNGSGADSGKSGISLALNFGDSKPQQTTTPLPLRSTDVAGATGNGGFNVSTTGQNESVLLAMAATSWSDLNIDRHSDWDVSLDEQTKSNGIVSQLLKSLRSFTQSVDGFFGSRLATTLDRWNAARSRPGSGSLVQPSDSNEENSLFRYWELLGRTLTDAPGAVLDLLDEIVPGIRPRGKSTENSSPPGTPETTSTTANAGRQVAHNDAHRNEFVHDLPLPHFLKNSPWDRVPTKFQASSPWTRPQDRSAALKISGSTSKTSSAVAPEDSETERKVRAEAEHPGGRREFTAQKGKRLAE